MKTPREMNQIRAKISSNIGGTRDKKPLVQGVAEDSNLFDKSDIFLATTESPRMSNWILDSGCSFHMYSIREHLDTY